VVVVVMTMMMMMIMMMMMMMMMMMTGTGRRKRKEAKEEVKSVNWWTSSMCSHAAEKLTEKEDIKMQCGVFPR
jgi:hypothetical protein